MFCAPHPGAPLLARRGGGEPGVEDARAPPAVFEGGPAVGADYLALVGHVRPRRYTGLRQAFGDLLRAFLVEITDHDAGALRRQGARHGAAYAARPSEIGRASCRERV